MRTFRIFCIYLTICLLPAFATHAHMGGHQPVDEAAAIATGTDLVGVLAKQGKLPEGWAHAELKEAKIVEVRGGKEWHLTFQAPPLAETLYLFLSIDGQVLGANFTGER